ncbi:MAG: lysoplasmalogenase [Cellulosilyticaceae bacterium]
MGVKLAVVMTGVLLGSLLVTTYRYHDSMLRVQNKTLASIGFVLVGVFALIERMGVGDWRWGAFVLLALIASLVGDIMLGLADYYNISIRNHYFTAGVVWFGMAHIFYSWGFITKVGWSLKDVWVPLIFVLITTVLSRLEHFDFKGTDLLIIFYVFLLGIMLTKAIDIGRYDVLGGHSVQVVVAAVLFVISDCLLMFKHFFKKSGIWMSLVGLTCYYVAQVLFARIILYL